MNEDGHRIVEFDPPKIVNQHCVLPVLPGDISIVKEGLRLNGYVDSFLIACRYATAPEIEHFYQFKPYNYRPEKAASVTRAAMQQGNSGGHFYCYDGHIRKFASIELIEENIFAPSFRLKSLLKCHLSTEDEIAYSLSRNGTQEFSVPLSFLGLLLRCYDYDEAVNTGKSKPLSAAEVGKRMVACSTNGVVDAKTKNKLAETRRQILGIRRKLPVSVIAFFRTVALKDSGAQLAFTVANLKCIKGKSSGEVVLALVKRLVYFYENYLPSPKPLQPMFLPDQIVSIQRALLEVDKFKKLCEFDDMPIELDIVVNNMKNTQDFYDEMADNATKE